MQTFKEMDQNGDGILTRDEILEAYKKFMDDE
jgi:EF hand